MCYRTRELSKCIRLSVRKKLPILLNQRLSEENVAVKPLLDSHFDENGRRIF